LAAEGRPQLTASDPARKPGSLFLFLHPTLTNMPHTPKPRWTDSERLSDLTEYVRNCLLLDARIQMAVAPSLYLGLMADKLVDQALVNALASER
jgi:hypothetical protein